ncbi:DNA-binding response regulator, LytR/AlgR family [Tenacibaculum sp. MAR_2010_89]|uniref:LytR/AlgR family response regulator transcription factor n=1 Tax=Tenacibaculum sp. MAR_2010_89 TaxID=1250198 RepID=UPI0008962AA4|nr:response regulator [Tenacibaculum sp. MAR_2010_89]SEE11432.1 DNA-binding response regulator, LytR/AlgR family [Tenacibaculum sp. MAR_2010_89]
MEAPIKVYIVEDIAISRMSLETMLLENNYIVSGSAAKAEVAWIDIQQTKPNLILLDINLSGDKNGIWLAQKVRENFKIPIVYLTAYGDQQTLKEVLETKPNGYLMKPYQEATLLTTITIALNNFLESEKEREVFKENNDSDVFIFIKDRAMKVKINTNDIYYIKSDGNYLEIKLKEKKYVVRNKLMEFKKQLPHTIFFQSHQRYLVNISKIKVVGKDYVSINDENIPLSLKYKKEVEQVLIVK